MCVCVCVCVCVGGGGSCACASVCVAYVYVCLPHSVCLELSVCHVYLFPSLACSFAHSLTLSNIGTDRPRSAFHTFPT